MGAPGNVPKTSTKRKSTTLKELFKQDPKSNSGVSGATKLPMPPPSAEPETEQLIELISSCNKLFTFIDSAESSADRDLKRDNLSKVLSFIPSAHQPLSNQILTPLITMLSINLFRPLPPPAYPCISWDLLEDDFPVMSLTPQWPHLYLIYDILFSLVANTDAKVLKNHINRSFLSNLLALFQSEDPRERDRLKNIYHQLYSKLTGERSYMRKSMSSTFLRFALETSTERHCGIGELLEICGSIINGFAVPLKEEHKVFLIRVLLPLHKPKVMGAYHKQLSYCVIQFVQKEPELSETIVRMILRHWPMTNCQKEVLLIGELEELAEILEPERFEKLAVPLCSQIAKSLISCNSQVAERALYVWNNEQFVKMVSNIMKEILPPIVGGIERNLKLHWSKSVQQLTMSVKTLLEGMDPCLYSKCLQELDLRELHLQETEMKRRLRWEMLEMAAAV